MIESFNHFGAIANELDNALSQIVRKVSFDLQGNMQKQIRANHQIDTGFMTNSVYVRTSEESTYSTSGSPSKKGQHKLEEVEAPPDKHTAYVGVGAAYGWYQNYGTSRQPARPFVEPAIETTRPSFDEAISRVEEKLRHVQ